MYSERTLGEVLTEVQYQKNIKKDYLVPGKSITMDQSGTKIVFSNNSNPIELKPTELFHTQMANSLGIPTRYYNLMAQEKPSLLADNVNSWLSDRENRFMVRSFLDPEIGKARALLSERYHIIDNIEVVTQLLPEFLNIDGLKVASCEITDDHLYIKIINERVTGEVTPGDFVQSGIVISNSEVGLGAVTIQPLLYRLVCTNGMIVNALSKRKYHVGKKLVCEDIEAGLFSNETIAADDKALFMKLKDVAKFALSETGLYTLVDTLKKSTNAQISGKTKDVVELTAKEFGLTEDEQDTVLENLIRDASEVGNGHTLYGLGNAITKASQESSSYERATELEKIGWNVVTMPSSMWGEINRKAA